MFVFHAGAGKEVINLTLSSDDTDFNLRTYVDAQTNYSGANAPIVNFTLAASADLSATSTSTRAFETGSWPDGTELNVTIDGRIMGKGGAGGVGCNGGGNGGNGSAGGDAMRLQHDLTLINENLIGAGGGGGGGGGSDNGGAGGGGGGGRSGNSHASGGAAGSGPGTPTAGGTGTPSGGGARGNGPLGPPPNEGYGGAGGSWGAVGETGQAGDTTPGTGGAAGRAINRNGYTLNLTNNGTIGGSIVG